jgi:hypothetical protein
MKVAWIPDTQVKPGVRTNHLVWAGRYLAEKKPDVVIHGGDHWDLPSLSSYDRGKASAEGRRVFKDIEAGNKALAEFTEALQSPRGYKPRKVMLRGNHENRLERYVEDNPELKGTVGSHLFNDVALGWEVVPFLKPVEIGGILFAHYFPRGGDGSVGQTKRGAPSASAQVKREMQSCVAGHQQGLQLAVHTNGRRIIRGIIAGSFYTHEESYLSPQGTCYWRGILLLHEVRNGEFNLCEVSLEYLKRKYSK